MKKIEATIGYREEYDNGEIRYYPGSSAQGYCYKDDKAFESGVGVAYICEGGFDPNYSSSNGEYITAEHLKAEHSTCTREQMLAETRTYLKDMYGGEVTDKMVEHATSYVYYELDWQCFYTLLSEVYWNEDFPLSD